MYRTQPLNRSRTEKRGGEPKILKRGQAGSRGGYLKKGGWNPPTNYAFTQPLLAHLELFVRL